jgi:hypothetical protein
VCIQLREFFFRDRNWGTDSLGFDPVPFPTIDPFLWRPVGAGLWRQHEMHDGTYTVADLIDAHEFLDVREENQKRKAEWEEAMRKR